MRTSGKWRGRPSSWPDRLKCPKTRPTTCFFWEDSPPRSWRPPSSHEPPNGRCVMYNSAHMSLKMNGFGSTALWVVLAAGLSAQTPERSSPAASQEKPTFKVQVDLVTNDIIARDEKGNFIPDLKKDEFEV